MKHTPGPWKIDESYATMLMIASSDDVPIAEVDCSMSSDAAGACIIDPEEDELANANLIAAAPELLEALEQCAYMLSEAIAFFGDDKDAQEALDKAQEIITKAKGVREKENLR